MSLLTPRQTEYLTVATHIVDVSDFESVNVIEVGTVTLTATAGVVDSGTFRSVTQTVTSGTSFSVAGFSHLSLVLSGTLNATNKVIVYGTINKIDRV